MQPQFERSAMLLGPQAIDRLRESHVVVFGLGGVGSYLTEVLARAGVGTLTLVDHDTVSQTNLNRQLYALHSTIGRPKVAVAAERIADINPHCRVFTHTVFFEERLLGSIFTEPVSFVADAIDTVSAKVALAKWAAKTGTPLLSCMGTGNKLDPTQLRVVDIFQTSGDPLCRVMRRELRAAGVPALSVVYSCEPARTPLFEPSDTAGKQTVGSVPFVPSAAGILMATHILQILTTPQGGNL